MVLIGIGGAPDADVCFKDGHSETGAQTLLHVAQACAAGSCEHHGQQGAPHLPHIDRLGLDAALRQASAAGYRGGRHAAPGAAEIARDWLRQG